MGSAGVDQHEDILNAMCDRCILVLYSMDHTA